MKKAFTLIEVALAILLISFLFTALIKSVKYLYQSNFINEMRYLALNRVDSEVARIVAYYKGSGDETITSSNLSPFKVESGYEFLIYTTDKISLVGGDNTHGLKIENNRNIVEIKNIDSEGEVVESDIVGLLGWQSIRSGNRFDISLSITYPYRYVSGNLEEVLNFTETINIQTSVVK